MANLNQASNTIDDLKIAQVNIRSIVSLAKREEFANFLRRYTPHIVLISETHLKPKHKIVFNRYKFYRNDRIDAACGGTAICVHENIKSVQVKSTEEIKSIEYCSIRVELDNGAFFLSAIYRKPSTPISAEDLTKLIKLSENNAFILAGDFNAHNPLWGSLNVCTNGRTICDWFSTNKNKFKMTIKSPKNPSCSAGQNGSFIDFAILSESLNITNCDSSNRLPSIDIFADHSVIFIEINRIRVQNEESLKFKNFKKTNWSRFNEYIDEKLINLKMPIHHNIHNEKIDEICLEIENIFKSAVEKFVPEYKVPYDKIELSRKSQSILKEKKRLMRRKYRNRNNANAPIIRSQLKLVNQMLIQSISEDYRKWWKSKLSGIKPDNNLFKNIKLISEYKSKQNMPSTIFNSDKSTAYTNEKEKCDAFADLFAKSHELTYNDYSLADNEVQRINLLYNNNEPIVNFSTIFPADFKNNPDFVCDQSIRKNFISTIDLKNVIASRNNKKSSGNDHMPNYALKKLSFLALYWLAILFNHITNVQHIPSNWKFASVTPVPKPSKNNNIVNNWRPISQLPTISKCYEKVLDNMIRLHCIENNLIDPFQFGFQPGSSTVHAIAKIFDDISTGLNRRCPTLAVLIDLQSAFDVIWHDGIVFKLHQLGLNPILIKLIKSFLSDRKFQVKINKECSNIKNIKAGTPQGSIISAILFILYLNDLPKPMNFFCKITRILFADDVIIYTATKNVALATNTMNNYLKQIHNFLIKWKLKINVNKCESISIVGHYKDLEKNVRKNALNTVFKINNELIAKVDKVKYLGVYLSKNFQFVDHVKFILNKVNAAQSLLSKIFNCKFISKQVKLIAYKQLIRPLMTYASPCWVNKNIISSYQIELLRKKERFFLRKCCNLFRNASNNKYVNSKILYDESKINRIDREIMKINCNFVEKSKQHSKQMIRDIANYDDPNVEDYKYKPTNYFYSLKSNNTLHTNGLFLIFNKKKYRPNDNIYVDTQNSIEY